MLIVFEGPDGCGKSTQAKLLYDALFKGGHNVYLTNEPGSNIDGVCIKLREILLNPNINLDPRSELLLMIADRAQHVSKIKPLLDKGFIIISDRFKFSTDVYQGWVGGHNRDFIDILNDWGCYGLESDLIFYLTIPIKVGLERSRRVTDKFESKFEDKDIEFHKKIHEAYKKVMRIQHQTYHNVVTLSGEEDINTLHESILARTLKERI